MPVYLRNENVIRGKESIRIELLKTAKRDVSYFCNLLLNHLYFELNFPLYVVF